MKSESSIYEKLSLILKIMSISIRWYYVVVLSIVNISQYTTSCF